MSLPIGKEKPEEGSRAASLAALVKGFLPKVSVDDFPAEPEMACQKWLENAWEGSPGADERGLGLELQVAWGTHLECQ